MDAPYAVGGCARDQSTTQYCGEAVAAHRRIAELEAAIDRAHKIIAANYMHQREKVHDGLVILREALGEG